MGGDSTYVPVKADPSRRVVAFIIDWLCTIPFQLVALIPLIGQFVALCCLIPYWLLRDVSGASVGKRFLGLRVVDYNGNTPRVGKRMRRNLLFVFPLLIIILPLIGAFGAAFAFVIVSIVEAGLIFSRGDRMGDRDAKCTVVVGSSQTRPL
jgi:uncharacterized RDD family membrane protein YckC